jgi:mRNA interferase HicA
VGHIRQYPDYESQGRTLEELRDNLYRSLWRYQRRFGARCRTFPDIGSGNLKREELLRVIKSIGCVLVRPGVNHVWYANPQTGKSQTVPRHNEIEDGLAKRIMKRFSQDAV